MDEPGCAHVFICRCVDVAGGYLAMVGGMGNGRSLGRLWGGYDPLSAAP